MGSVSNTAEMKLLCQFLIAFAAANSMTKERRHMFLSTETRSKCGDSCAKDKDSCHRTCEAVGVNKNHCDCCCVNENKRCKCNRCGFEDGCEETIWEPCNKLIC